MVNIVEKSFQINIKVMRLFGLYPSGDNTFSGKAKGVVLYLVLLVLTSVLMFIRFLSEENADNVETNILMMYLAHVGGLNFKLIPFLKNGVRIERCVNYFTHSRFSSGNTTEKQILDECVHICRRNSTVFFFGLTVGWILWILQLMFGRSSNLPIDLWLPYDPKDSALKYYPTLFLLSAAFYYHVFSGTMLDPMIGGLVYHATCQLKILKYRLTNLEKFLSNHYQTKQDSYQVIKFEMLNRTLDRCIDLHQDILYFVTEVEECFSWSVLCQITAGMLIMCFACIGFLLTSTESFETIINMAVILLVQLQILFFCYYGTLLYEENEGLITSIYMGPWYTYDIQIRKTLITVMERSKRPLIITSGKIFPIILSTFVSVVKTSYSLIAVFKNYQ